MKKLPKTSVGYKVWVAGFTLLYPILSVFTAAFTLVLKTLSWVSQGLFWLLSRFETKR